MFTNRLHWTLTILLLVAVIGLFLKSLSSPKEINSIGREEIHLMVSEAIENRVRQEARDAYQNIEREYALAEEETLNVLQYGDGNARINMQMFSDIECPICRKMHPVLKQIVDSSQGVINWEYRHFPLAQHNPAAAVESQAIECIRESYGNRNAWVMLEVLFNKTLSNGKGVDSLPAIARSYGMSGSLIENCLASDGHKEKINSDYELGRGLGINATPAIKITDRKTNKTILVRGYKTPEQLLLVISELLK
jgi:protein-disulfide isomerase